MCWIIESGVMYGFLLSQTYSQQFNFYLCDLVFLRKESIVCPEMACLPGLALAAWHVQAHTRHSYLQEVAREPVA